MNLNLNYYKNDIDLEDITKDEEDTLIKYINEYDKEKYQDIFENDKRVFVVSNLSSTSSNIIDWYPIKPSDKVLEINPKFGQYTEKLCKKASKVVSLEFSKKRSEAILVRHKDLQNLEIVCSNLEDFNTEEKFDYITLIDVVEYLDKILMQNEGDLLENIILKLEKYLKPNGKFLIATDNKFGAKYFSGVVNKEERPFLSVVGKTNFYSKSKLKKTFENTGYNYEFYYPLPDYKLSNVIYSDKYLPNALDTKINYHRYCHESSMVIFDELQFFKEIIKENKFDFFCNSYFIELSKNLEDNIPKPIFISYNSTREEKYRLSTKIYKDKVLKEATTDLSKGHILNISHNIDILNSYGFNIIDKVEDEVVYGKFIQDKSFDKYLIDVYLQYGKERLLREINNWYINIKEKLQTKKVSDYSKIDKRVQLSNEKLEKLTLIEDGLIDLVFENTFYINNEYLFFDQEWYVKNIPLEFILYRSINNLFSYNVAVLEKENKDEIFEYFGINDYIEEFESFEKSFQSEINSKTVEEFYESMYHRTYDDYVTGNTNYAKKLEGIIEELKEENKNLGVHYNALENERNHYKQKYEEIVNAKNWRFAKKIIGIKD